MVCMSAFFTAPFNMYANAGRLHSHTRRPIKAPFGRASFEATGSAALIDGVRGWRQMTGFCNFFLPFSGAVGGGQLKPRNSREDLNICKIVWGFGGAV